MQKEYFLEQAANVIHASVFMYHESKGLKVISGSGKVWKKPGAARERLLREEFRLDEDDVGKDYPILCVMEEQMIFVKIRLGEGCDFLIVGPILPEPVGSEQLLHIRKTHKSIQDLGIQIYPCDLDEFISGMLLIYMCFSDECMSKGEFWAANSDNYAKIREIPSRVSQDIFFRQENYGPHNPYDQEQRELESIRNGDTDSLERSIAEIYKGQIGILARNPLRHHKNVAIGNITLASRSAIVGGLNVEQSFSMADSFIQQVEELETVPEVELFKREAQRIYAKSVKEVRRKDSGDSNPLIGEVKNYIFSHLHSSIRVADIAKHLNVNADYLSHLFSSQEGVTLKQYILQEKIRRSRNLLRYSDFSIQEIGFYLGFCSQSHFSRTFQSIVEMTPNEYRKRFGGHKDWTIL